MVFSTKRAKQSEQGTQSKAGHQARKNKQVDNQATQARDQTSDAQSNVNKQMSLLSYCVLISVCKSFIILGDDW